MLVIMKYRDVHALLEAPLDLETLGCPDIFQIDTAKSGFQRGNNIDKFIWIPLVDLYIEHIDIRKSLKQDTLALHHWLECQGSDSTQTQHCRTVGDDRNKIATRGDRRDLSRVGDDEIAGSCYTRRVGKGQVMLGGKRLTRYYLDFTGRKIPVIFQCLLVIFTGYVMLPWGVLTHCRRCNIE